MGHTYSMISSQDDEKLTPFDDLLARIQSKEKDLTTVDLTDITNITPQQLSHLFRAISKNNQITSLDITGIPINKTTAEELAVLPIDSLIAKNCQLNDDNIALLAKSRSITKLDVSCNNFGEKGVAALAKNEHLKELHVRSNHLGHASKDLLSPSQFLVLVDLSLNQIMDEDVKSMQCPLTLEILILNGNQITQTGAIALIKHNNDGKHRLKEIGLRNNRATSAVEIQKFLTDTLTDTKIYMWHNSGISNEISRVAVPTLQAMSC